MNYADKHALVLGLGESGLAMARWLVYCGARVRVADTRGEQAVAERLATLRAASTYAAFIGGQAFAAGLLDGIDFVAVSPGLAPERDLAVLSAAAAEKNIPLWGEMELFAQALAALREERAYAPKVLAITGTNGKTTVTSLTGRLCRRAGLTTRVAGNIGPAVLDVLREALIEEKAHAEAVASASVTVVPLQREAPPQEVERVYPGRLPQAWVLELSSFQLHMTYSLQADAATVLNVTQDHLDWHGSMDAYIADKARIFGAKTVCVLNRDDAVVMQMAPSDATVSGFGLDEPVKAGDFGLVDENGMLWLSTAVLFEDKENPAGRRRRKDPQEAPEPAFLLRRLMPVDALRIRGLHNALNAMAALALCRAVGLPLADLLHGLRDYAGESHRTELVATIGDVAYYNDSKGTNVGATVAALNGFGHGGKPNRLLLIAGGDGKGQDFSPLAEPLSKYGRAVFLIGRDAGAIRAAVADTGITLIDCATLEAAVEQAAGMARGGDAVLLSPACASLDMFRNYAHRAEVFIDAVREIALSHGEVTG
ncbi:MAG: UDP-N-acetylmuramoyl-L-alanine--D-glutamate ligase [Herbaspirillum sp.]